MHGTLIEIFFSLSSSEKWLAFYRPYRNGNECDETDFAMLQINFARQFNVFRIKLQKR